MSPEDLRQQLQALWRQANELYAAGRWPEAVGAYSKVLELAPQFVPAYVQRGLIVREMGQPEKALQDFERAIHLDPQCGPAYHGRGWVRHARGDYQGELQDARRGLLLDPEHAGMYYRRIGAAQHGLKQHQEAIESYNQAISLNSERDEGTLYNRGLCYAEMKEYQLALADFDQCLVLDPDWAWALDARPKVHLTMGSLDRAVADCDEAIRYQPGYVASYLTRAGLPEKGRPQADAGGLQEAPADHEVAGGAPARGGGAEEVAEEVVAVRVGFLQQTKDEGRNRSRRGVLSA